MTECNTANETSLITIRGARQNNLKNVNVDIRPGTLTVITGPSGSGKSSLAFDTLYAEGQRRYAETFSPYARQFLERSDRPKVDKIDGVPPAIAINQSGTVRTSRSTVGTMTELDDHLKLLFAHEAHLFCPDCGRAVSEMAPGDMWNDLKTFMRTYPDARVYVLFPVFEPKEGNVEQLRADLSRQGFTHIEDEKKTKDGTTLWVAADRFKMEKATDERGTEAFEKAGNNGLGPEEGLILVRIIPADADQVVERRYAKGLVCPDCGTTFKAPKAAMFSFNSPVGACPECRGFGRVMGLDLKLAIPDPDKPIKSGIKLFTGQAGKEAVKDLTEAALHRKPHFNILKSWNQLTEDERLWLLNGDRKSGGTWYGIYGFWNWLESKNYKMHVRVLLSRFRSYTTCHACGGARLKADAMNWRVGSRAAADAAVTGTDGKNTYKRFVGPSLLRIASQIDQTLPGLTLHDMMLLPVSRLKAFIDALDAEVKDEAGRLILSEIRRRLVYLMDVGLGYLTLDRQSRTLSGGEVQRVNLTTALGTNLVDTLFVLDEPSIGLHPRDMDRVNAIMANLKNAGNTLVVVEHDPQVMLSADRIIDMGPQAGSRGGEIVFDGTPAELKKGTTVTGQYLSGKLTSDVCVDAHLTPDSKTKWLTVKNAHAHNLKHLTARIPVGMMTTVTGVSGSGKSTLVADTIVPWLMRHCGQPVTEETLVDTIEGADAVTSVNFVDQTEIGRTSRSSPALYIGAFEDIRKLFANTVTARDRGYDASWFSFNYGPGRCPTCEGAGVERVEMQFLSDVVIECADCHGTRYRDETLEVKFKFPDEAGPGRNIADVLAMTAEDAVAWFGSHAAGKTIARKLQPLVDVGLGYLTLGQSVSSLSGGEAQRLKLAGILGARDNGKPCLFVFDEPTTGLHFSDIAKLIPCLRRLTDAGHTVLIVEHNLDVIAASDWVIDLGPEGGIEGGTVVTEGTPADLMRAGKGYTAQALNAYRKALADPESRMKGWFTGALPAIESQQKSPGRSLQSVWREARKGDLGIFGAREHNLKGIDVVFPKRKLTAVTGVSGSGKSTLAFGIAFAEGQRRYLESLNAYARSMIQPPARADFDRIVGISPTVAIEQRTSRGSGKSTVATMTEILHYLRLIYLKLGVQHCPRCGIPVTNRTVEETTAQIMKDLRNRTITFTAPVVQARKGIYTELAKDAVKAGIPYLYVDDKWVRTDEFPALDRYKDHTICWPVGTTAVEPGNEKEVRRLIRAAVEKGAGTLRVFFGTQSALTPEGIPSGQKRSAKSGDKIYSTERTCPQCGASFPALDPRLFSYNHRMGWCEYCEGQGTDSGRYISLNPQEDEAELKAKNVCPYCKGTRLNRIARNVFFHNFSIGDVSLMSVDDCLTAFRSIHLEGREKLIGEDAFKEIISRLEFLQSVGLGYLSLNRGAPTLSGGESQRIRLASQLGSNLQGVCYVLDEPTIGLHPRDNRRLIQSLTELKNKGNTVLVVEHDEDTIRAADHIVDIGPGAGSRGGELLCEGTLDELMAEKRSVTGEMLRHPTPHTGRARRPVTKVTPKLEIKGAYLHNLKKIDVSVPLGRLVVLTGISGSGKSTLAHEVIAATVGGTLASLRGDSLGGPVGCESFTGMDYLDRLLEVDQTPIGKTPRSCPATYVEFSNRIRDIFAATNEAQARGYTASRFSFNTEVGRCPVCDGQGQIRAEMNFLPDVVMECEACHGMRFDDETLAVKWHGKSIGDVLQLSVDEAIELFGTQTTIVKPLQLMQDVGLGYLKLGQPSNTLSGGEAQRIKLVTELAKAKTPKDIARCVKATRTLYILDEPTVGLHMADVARLINVLHRLVDAGNTVLVVEHNLDVIAEADCIIDLGPEGGPQGGSVVALGDAQKVAKSGTATGVILREFLKDHKPSAADKKKLDAAAKESFEAAERFDASSAEKAKITAEKRQHAYERAEEARKLFSAREREEERQKPLSTADFLRGNLD